MRGLASLGNTLMSRGPQGAKFFGLNMQQTADLGRIQAATLDDRAARRTFSERSR